MFYVTTSHLWCYDLTTLKILLFLMLFMIYIRICFQVKVHHNLFLSFLLLTFLLWLSVQFSCSAMSDTLWPQGLQHARLPCPSPTLGAYSNSHLSSQWCQPTISSSVVPFSSSLQSFPASLDLFQWVSSLHQVAKVLWL